MRSWSRALIAEASALIRVPTFDDENDDDDANSSSLTADNDHSTLIDEEPPPLVAIEDEPQPPPSKPHLYNVQLPTAIRHATLRYDTPAHSLPPQLSSKCLQLNSNDAATLKFLHKCLDDFSSSICSYHSISHRLLKPALSVILSHTDVNGVLDIGQMFLLSTEHITALLTHSGIECSLNRPAYNGTGWLLDVGAGCGGVTSQVSQLFGRTFATEVSSSMISRLKARGFAAIQTGDISTGIEAHIVFDCITIFNVIDRCLRPLQLIDAVKRRVRNKHSRIIIATPLPLDPWFEDGQKWVIPEQSIINTNNLHGNDTTSSLSSPVHTCCMSWSESAQHLCDQFEHFGMIVHTIARVPYLSQGNIKKPFFVLDDAVFVLSVPDAPDFKS